MPRICLGMRPHLAIAVLVAGTLAAGCAEERRGAVRTVPADQRQTTDGGEITVRGDYGPAERGPFAFAGRYRVRFVQRGASVDFAREVPFTAHLEQGRRRVRLFQAAARTGGRQITARGRFRVVVDFGDSPHEIRFTPAGDS
jgi:hypothetical protein